MPFEDLPSRLEDILDAITDVTQFIAGRSFDEYQRDKLLRLAIERCIEIISEASRHIPPDMKARGMLQSHGRKSPTSATFCAMHTSPWIRRSCGKPRHGM
jgi:hypothetical protein